MIPQEALDQVRGRVMRRLRVRRAIRQVAVVAALLVAVLVPFGLRLPPAETLALARPAGPVAPAAFVRPQQIELVVARVVAARVVPVAARPAYIKIFTENPDVVILLLNSETEGGLE